MPLNGKWPILIALLFAKAHQCAPSLGLTAKEHYCSLLGFLAVLPDL